MTSSSWGTFSLNVFCALDVFSLLSSWWHLGTRVLEYLFEEIWIVNNVYFPSFIGNQVRMFQKKEMGRAWLILSETIFLSLTIWSDLTYSLENTPKEDKNAPLAIKADISRCIQLLSQRGMFNRKFSWSPSKVEREAFVADNDVWIEAKDSFCAILIHQKLYLVN